MRHNNTHTTYTHTLSCTHVDEGLVRRRNLYWQHTTVTKDRHPRSRQDSNP